MLINQFSTLLGNDDSPHPIPACHAGLFISRTLSPFRNMREHAKLGVSLFPFLLEVSALHQCAKHVGELMKSTGRLFEIQYAPCGVGLCNNRTHPPATVCLLLSR